MEDDAQRLYLFTLEVVPLTVGAMYSPLPSHLTLISRFWSEQSPEVITNSTKPLFDRTKRVELLFEQAASIGPKHTAVHLIELTEEIKHVHEQLRSMLDDMAVAYANPHFVGKGYKPHVSKRQGDGFAPGYRQVANAAYLIEVEIHGEQHLRFIRAKYPLGAFSP